MRDGVAAKCHSMRIWMMNLILCWRDQNHHSRNPELARGRNLRPRVWNTRRCGLWPERAASGSYKSNLDIRLAIAASLLAMIGFGVFKELQPTPLDRFSQPPCHLSGEPDPLLSFPWQRGQR